VNTKTRHRIYTLILVMGLSVTGLTFHGSIEQYCSTVSWVEVLSMIIFLGGVFYAVLERNVVVGIVSVMAALILPWIKEWAVAYWPLVREYFITNHW